MFCISFVSAWYTPQHYYPGEDNEEDEGEDRSDLAQSGTVTYTEGKIGRAFNLTGNVYLVNDSIDGFDDICTIDFWFYITAKNNDAQLWSCGDGTTANYLFNPTTATDIKIYLKNDPATESDTTVGVLAINRWFHVAIVLGADGMDFYLNGTKTHDGSAGIDFDAAFTKLFIGEYQYQQLYAGEFEGFIDNFAAFTECYSQDNVTASYNNYLGTNFSEAPPVDPCIPPATGNFSVDCSDYCNWTSADEIPGNITMTGSGLVNLSSAWNFTSSNQRITINSGCTFAISSGGEFT